MTELELFSAESEPSPSGGSLAGRNVSQWQRRDPFGVPVLVAALGDETEVYELGPIAAWLEYSQADRAAKIAGDDQILTLTIPPEWRVSRMGRPDRLFVTRIGINRITNKSGKPEAVRIQRLWTDEVQIALEDTGTYTVPAQRSVVTSMPDFTTVTPDVLAFIGQLGEAAAAGSRAALAARNQVLQLEAARAQDAPLVEQALHHRSTRSITAVADFANDLQDWVKDNGIRAKVLHEDVRDFLGYLGLIIRGNTIRNNQPKGAAINAGYVRPHNHDYGSTARLTRKGYGYVWDRITPHIKETGSAKPPTKTTGGMA